MVDSNNNWDDDEDTTNFFIIRGEVNIDDTPEEETQDEIFSLGDRPNRKHCEKCNKDRVQVRCVEHPNATGCNFCHITEEHVG